MKARAMTTERQQSDFLLAWPLRGKPFGRGGTPLENRALPCGGVALGQGGVNAPYKTTLFL